MPDSRLLELALAAVADAMRLCEAVAADFGEGDAHAKEDRSPVTVADYGSQALILHRLSLATPDLGVVAEEQGEALRLDAGLRERVAAFTRALSPDVDNASLPDWLDWGAHSGGARGRFWTLDPIDGTKGYLRGGQYAVALALIEDGVPVLGVLGCPRYEGTPRRAPVMFSGGHGLPPRLHSLVADEAPIEIRVSAQATVAGARLCESVEAEHTAHGRSAALADRLGLSPDPIRMDSQAKYAAVAHGAACLYMRLPVKRGYREKIWDHAAGVAVIEAAGGQVSDLNGKPLDFGRGEALEGNRGVLATNGFLHGAVLEAVRATTPEGSDWE